MPSDTRRRLIDAALVRFKREGFRNVGIDQILADVGISKTAFYKHFPSKDDLMVEALGMHTAFARETFQKLARERGGPTAIGQLRALFDVVEWITTNNEFHGCVFINAAIEFPLLHDPAHKAAQRNRTVMSEMIHDMAERAGAADPTGMAEELCLLMEGVYVGVQVTGRHGMVAAARRLAEDAIRRHLGVTAAASSAYIGIANAQAPMHTA